MRTFCTLLALLMIGGCINQNNQTPFERVSQGAANDLGSSNQKFEEVKDPAFTAPTRFAAGQLAESQRNFPAAIEQYKMAIKIDSKHTPSLFRLGTLYAQSRRFPEAIDVWKQYVRATNNSATAYGNLAFCYEVAGQVHEAEAAYKAGITREPKNRLCRINYGLMLARLGRTSEASEQLGAVLKPEEVHYNLGSVFEHVGKKDDAKSEYEKALQLNPSFWDAKKRLDRLEHGLTAAQ